VSVSVKPQVGAISGEFGEMREGPDPLHAEQALPTAASGLKTRAAGLTGTRPSPVVAVSASIFVS
jgi:hypothetical protein